MPWRLIQFILIFAVLLLFVIFNLTNKCDISFGFTVIKDAPVFLTVFASFILGMFCTLPFVFGAGSRKKNKEKKPDKKKGKPDLPKKPDADSGKSPENDDYSDKKHYGID